MISGSNRFGFTLRAVLILSASGLAAAMSGCGESQPDFTALRSAFLSDQLPADVLSIGEAQVADEGIKDLHVVGRIFADQISPFDSESAAFNIIELPKPGHSHEDPGDCPFCKREMLNAPTALVQVVDAEGQVLKPSADQIFGLSKSQNVVVTGTLSKVGDALIISASSLHLLSDDNSQEFAKRIHAEETSEEEAPEEEAGEAKEDSSTEIAEDAPPEESTDVED